MTSNPWRGWNAQPPPADFAAQTVGRILRDRHERRKKGTARRWVTLAAAATVLMAGGAWAWTALPRETRPLPVVPVDAPAKPSPPSQGWRPANKVPDPIPEPAAKAPAAPVLPLHRRKETLPPPPDAGRKVIVPRCNCQEGICDCLEQH